ncbi:MAG: hypothetical protein Q4C53_05585 [Clostridia bacterium]|nr:hypothetical protein [Clostridia bacterium]
MSVFTDPEHIFRELAAGVAYKQRIGLFDTVRENEAFFVGRQWEGLEAPDLEKPVLNILKRAVCYFAATVKKGATAFTVKPWADGTEGLCLALRRAAEEVFEQDGTETKLADCVRAAAVDGDACLYWYYDPVRERIRSERIRNTEVFFLNPYEPAVDAQRGILIRTRRPYDELRAEAAENGAEGWENILPDDPAGLAPDAGEPEKLATVVTKFFRTAEGISAVSVARGATVRPPFCTGLTRYPIAWLRWDEVTGSCHGQAAVTGLVPNQIIINKLFSMYVRSVETNAFPKVVYDITKFGRGGWTNRIGEAIGVYGDVGDCAVNVLRGGDTSAQVMQVIESAIRLTRETMGATDAAMGSINAENTAASAILASQRASAEPLALQRRAYLAFFEECVRIVFEWMSAAYGVRTVRTDEGDLDVDFSLAAVAADRAVVHAGDAAEWSETGALSTLKELIAAGLPVTEEELRAAVPERLEA